MNGALASLNHMQHVGDYTSAFNAGNSTDIPPRVTVGVHAEMESLLRALPTAV